MKLRIKRERNYIKFNYTLLNLIYLILLFELIKLFLYFSNYISFLYFCASYYGILC